MTFFLSNDFESRFEFGLRIFASFWYRQRLKS
jgi:hypothetical protein